MSFNHILKLCSRADIRQYRIDQRRESVLSSIAAEDLPYLLEHDQLRKEMRANYAFRLRSFTEPHITFRPTYKYNTGSAEYDSSEKRRIPAWWVRDSRFPVRGIRRLERMTGVTGFCTPNRLGYSH